MGFLLFSVAYGIWLALLYKRIPPVILMRVWFTLMLFITLSLCNISCRVLALIIKDDRKKFEMYCRLSKTFIFHYFFRPNIPHIHIRFMEGSLGWDGVIPGCAVCCCHTSFFDALLFLCVSPLEFMRKGKTFLKAGLQNLPIFGYVVRCCGHFPVYFADENSASFSVQKEKQAKVAEDVEEHLADGGYLCFFPEGALNKNPDVLTTFRAGSFNTILKHKLPLRYISISCNAEVWNPKLKGVPGFPADLYVYVGEYKYDPNTDGITLATEFREVMQNKLDQILEQKKKDNYKPWYEAPPAKKD